MWDQIPSLLLTDCMIPGSHFTQISISLCEQWGRFRSHGSILRINQGHRYKATESA